MVFAFNPKKRKVQSIDDYDYFDTKGRFPSQTKRFSLSRKSIR